MRIVRYFTRAARATWVAAVLASVLFGGAARAAVSLVDDGSGGTQPRILIHSAIVKGDYARFEGALARILERAPPRINDVPLITVELDSPGGDVVEAVQIGRAISRNFAMTLVRPGHECVSACVFVLVAGAVHTPANGASIGVHRPLLVSWHNITAREAHARYDQLMAYLQDYFRALGVDEDAYRLMMGTDSLAMHYFTTAELDRLKLRGEDPAWEKLYAARWSAEQLGDALRLPPRPRIAPIDESLRMLVFMPGAYHPGENYLAGLNLPRDKFVWQMLDDDPQAGGGGPDLASLLLNWLVGFSFAIGPAWWLIALFLFELVRGRHSPWPRTPHLGKQDFWRTLPFSPRDRHRQA